MSIGTFVVSSSSTESSTCKAVLAYSDDLRNAILSGTAVTGGDTAHPVNLIFDDLYNTEWSVNFSGYPTTCQFIFSFTGVKQMNYFAIFSKNAGDCGLSVVVEVLKAESGSYEAVAGFGSMTNAKPVMVYFGDDYTVGYVNALAMRVTLTYTSKPYIAAMMAGKSIVFPRTFSTGFQPPAYIDEVEQFYSDDGLNLVSGRRLERGKQLKGDINYVRMDQIETFWSAFHNHVLSSKPLFLMWNTNKPDVVIYGAQVPERLSKPSYKNPIFSSLSFEVVGWA